MSTTKIAVDPTDDKANASNAGAEKKPKAPPAPSTKTAGPFETPIPGPKANEAAAAEAIYDPKRPDSPWRPDLREDAKAFLTYVETSEAPAMALADYLQQRAKWEKAEIVARIREKFGNAKLARVKGKPAPGSWPHYCATQLLADEKYVSVYVRAMRYLKEHGEIKLLEHLDDADAHVPAVHQVARLSSVESEAKQKSIHEKLFSGKYLTADEFEAAIPKKSAGNNHGPKPYNPGDIGDGSVQTCKRAIDSFGKEDDAVWIANESEGSEAALAGIQAALKELAIKGNDSVRWMVWVKK